jgi:hypothetical protein
MNEINQNNELRAYAVALVLSDNAEQRNRILRMNHTQFSLFKRTNTHCDNDSTSNGNCQTKMSWLSETNGGALVKPAKSPFHEKRLKYRKKSNPENPQASTSYFANCERDKQRHCLPKGESEGSSSDSSEATEIKKHEGKIKKIGSTIASIFANASTTVYTHLTDILDTAEEHARSQMTKHSDAIQHELGVSANTAMLIVSHAFAYVHTKLKKKLSGKDLDYTEIAEYVIKVLEAVYSDLGVTTFPLPTLDEVKHMLSLKHTPNAKLLKKSILDYRKKSTEPSNTQAGESYFATCERGDDGKCLPKGESGSGEGGDETTNKDESEEQGGQGKQEFDNEYKTDSKSNYAKMDSLLESGDIDGLKAHNSELVTKFDDYYKQGVENLKQAGASDEQINKYQSALEKRKKEVNAKMEAFSGTINEFNSVNKKYNEIKTELEELKEPEEPQPIPEPEEPQLDDYQEIEEPEEPEEPAEIDEPEEPQEPEYIYEESDPDEPDYDDPGDPPTQPDKNDFEDPDDYNEAVADYKKEHAEWQNSVKEAEQSNAAKKKQYETEVKEVKQKNKEIERQNEMNEKSHAKALEKWEKEKEKVTKQNEKNSESHEKAVEKYEKEKEKKESELEKLDQKRESAKSKYDDMTDEFLDSLTDNSEIVDTYNSIREEIEAANAPTEEEDTEEEIPEEEESNQKSLFVYLKKSQPTNPQAGDSYFGNCERDKQGHCLPKGESEGESQEEAPAKDYKEASERAISQLSKEGKNAIYYYTSTGYGTINSEMRKCPPKFECVDKDILKKANAIRTAIEVAGKFPKPVDVSRGLYITDPVIREALVKQLESIHANDGYFQWPSLASTSTNSNTANEFGSSGAFGIMFQIKAKSGLYVESVTANTGENEIIQSWKTRYKIKNIEMTPKGGRVVHMEEI